MTVQKLVLIVQPVRLQALIWQAALKSQQLAVIVESPETDLVENLDQLKAAGLVLPDLLILDIQNLTFNHFEFCRWCREQYSNTKVVLTNSGQPTISLSERQWAVNQGASDLLPGFQRETLVSGVATAVKRVLEVLDDHPLNNSSLISVLLSMKRALDGKVSGEAEGTKSSKRSTAAALKQAAGENSRYLDTTPNGKTPIKAELVEQERLVNGHSLSNGFTAIDKIAKSNGTTSNGKNGNGKKAAITLEAEAIADQLVNFVESTTTNGNSALTDNQSPQTASSEVEQNLDTDMSDPAHTNQRTRRYRGLYY